jgi:hypothetical protein
MPNSDVIETALPNPETLFKGFRHPYTGLTHVMTDEDRNDQLYFIREFVRDLNPRGYAEITFARHVALDSWRLNRIKAVEENIFAYGQVLPDKHFTNEVPQVEHAIGHAHTYMRFAQCLDKISLYESRLSRNMARNLDLLLKLQATRTERRNLAQVVPIDEPRPQTATAGAATAESLAYQKPAA